MAMRITEGRRRQRSVTRWAVTITLGLHALLLLWRSTIPPSPDPKPSIGRIVQPEPPRTPAPDIRIRPPKDLPAPDIIGFDPPPLPSNLQAGAGDAGPVVYMDVPRNDHSAVERAMFLPIVPPRIEVREWTRIADDLGRKLLEPLAPADHGAKVELSGLGSRISGHTAIAILGLPGADEGYPWAGGELEMIADFISRNTNLRIELSSRAISFVGSMACFDSWLDDARGRSFP